MKFKEEIKKTFSNPKELDYYRTKSSSLVLAWTAFLFFFSYFLIGGGYYPNTLSRILAFFYIVFVFSIFLFFYNFFHYKFNWKNKLFLFIIALILFLLFIFFSLPFIVSVDTLKSII